MTDKKTRILVVEDEKISALYLKEFLLSSGFEVVGICNTGKCAIEKSIQLKPELIVMDIMLKDNISGAEAAVKIANAIQTKIIFITAYSDPEMLDYAIDAHASAYVIKPYKDEQILATLKLALKEKEPLIIPKTMIQLSSNTYYDLQKEKAYVYEGEILMSHKCAKLLHILVKQRNHTLSHQTLALNVYGEIKNTSTIRTLIHRLRGYIGDDIIQNVNKTGYTVKEYTEQ
jgi:DNA-binding response OmpR family regulator